MSQDVFLLATCFGELRRETCRADLPTSCLWHWYEELVPKISDEDLATMQRRCTVASGSMDLLKSVARQLNPTSAHPVRPPMRSFDPAILQAGFSL